MKEILLFFIVCYVLVFIVYFIAYYLLGRKKKTLQNSVQFRFLKIKFNLKDKDLKEKKLGVIITLIDTLIISITSTIVTSLKLNYVFSLLVGFVLLMGFIYSFYEILGRIIKRKVDKK